MPSFASLGLPNDATKLRFKEPFVSEAMNLKDAGIVPPGIFRGFTSSPQPGFLLNFNVDATSLDSVAAVETTQHYNMTVRANSTLSVDMTGQVIFPVFAVLRTTYGITPTPLAGFTFSNILIVKPTLNNADPQSLNTGDVKLCKVLGFIGTVPNISSAVPTERQDNGGPLLTQASAVPSVMSSQEAEDITGVATVNGTTVYALIPGTAILLNLLATQTVLFEGLATIGLSGSYNAQLGIRIDGIDYNGTGTRVSSSSANDRSSIVVHKSVLLVAGVHTAQLVLRQAIAAAGNAATLNSVDLPTRLTAIYMGATAPAACLMPGFFTDCFTGLAGPIPTGGWSVAYGPLGTTTFDGDQMVQTAGPSTYAAAGKALPGVPPVTNLTLQFQFTEAAGPGVRTYSVQANGAAGKPRISLQLQAGVIQLLLGTTDPIPTWTGVYAVVPSAVRLVHMTVDGGGTPTLWIDGVSIPLAAGGLLPAVPIGPVNSITVTTVIGPGLAATATYDWLFFDTVVRPPTTIFCCPGGSPAQ